MRKSAPLTTPSPLKSAGASTVMVTSLVVVKAESLPVNRSTYVPAAVKVAVVAAALGLAKLVNVPGPETWVHAPCRWRGDWAGHHH